LEQNQIITEANTIKIKEKLGWGLAAILMILGSLHIGAIICFKTKYIICITITVLILILAAATFEIAEKSRGILWLKCLYFMIWGLLGSAIVALVILPFIVIWQDWRPYDIELMTINLGMVFLLFFLKELIRNWKTVPSKHCKPQKLPKSEQSDDFDGYFEELPRMVHRKKGSQVYFD
jgi:glucan phosphoethanolaminetransferase (alkaline phosphatase superfamily)